MLTRPKLVRIHNCLINTSLARLWVILKRCLIGVLIQSIDLLRSSFLAETRPLLDANICFLRPHFYYLV